MSSDDLHNASVTLEQLLPRFPNISKFMVSQSGAEFTVFPEVSPRIKDPVRRHTIQRNAITTLGDIAHEIGKNAQLRQAEPTTTDNLSLSFPSRVDLFHTLNAAEARIKTPSARINPTTETLGKA